MGDDPFGPDARRHDVARPHLAPAALAGLVALGLVEDVEEGLGGRGLAELRHQVEGSGRVAQDLHGLDAGEVVEEPAAARVHQERLALELQQGQGLDVIGARPAVLGDEVLAA